MTHLSIPLYRLLRWVKIQRKSGSILLDNQHHMSEDDLLDMDYFLNEDDPFDDLFGEEGFYIF